VVAEGYVPSDAPAGFMDYDLDEFGRPRFGGIAQVLAPLIEERLGIESRATVLDTSSAAASRSATTGCSPPGSAPRPWTSSTPVASAAWWRCAAPRSSTCR